MTPKRQSGHFALATSQKLSHAKVLGLDDLKAMISCLRFSVTALGFLLRVEPSTFHAKQRVTLIKDWSVRIDFKQQRRGQEYLLNLHYYFWLGRMRNRRILLAVLRSSQPLHFILDLVAEPLAAGNERRRVRFSRLKRT